MPRGIYPRKPRTEVSVEESTDHQPLYMELVVPPEGLIIKVLDNPQHVSCTVHLTRDTVSYAGSNGKKRSSPLSWKNIQKIADLGLALTQKELK